MVYTALSYIWCEMKKILKTHYLLNVYTDGIDPRAVQKHQRHEVFRNWHTIAFRDKLKDNQNAMQITEKTS